MVQNEPNRTQRFGVKNRSSVLQMQFLASDEQCASAKRTQNTRAFGGVCIEG